MSTRGVAAAVPEVQFQALLQRGIDNMYRSNRPIPFVFDALDEFGSHIGSYKHIMRLFINQLAPLSTNIRILATSRPEPYIGRILGSSPPNLDDDEEIE
ncbi:hypothetical protein HGRIS_011936 [Hohenbuehelia grisea]|uniref:Uncharacterized protein n=1 Tax=Hohenbuehelia grisea TaxID=104357 RepID=A0ABR3JYP0_9AGAR